MAAAVEVAGREATDGRLRGSTTGEACWEPGTAMESEFVDDLAEGRVRESFFMFLRDRGLSGEGRSRLSESECAEGGGLSPTARITEAGSWIGVSILRDESADDFLRGLEVRLRDCILHASVKIMNGS